MLMGILAPGFAHARPSAQAPIDMSKNCKLYVSTESPSNISPNCIEKWSTLSPLSGQNIIFKGFGGVPEI